MIRLDYNVRRHLSAAIFDLHVSEVGDANDWNFVRRQPIRMTTVPDRLAAPMIWLIWILAMTAILK